MRWRPTWGASEWGQGGARHSGALKGLEAQGEGDGGGLDNMVGRECEYGRCHRREGQSREDPFVREES